MLRNKSQLDYWIKDYYPAWHRGKNNSPITSYEVLYTEVTLFQQYVCDKVNEHFGTKFEPLIKQKVDSELGKKIHTFLISEKDFMGMFDSNWHELADDYWGRNISNKC